MKINWGTGLALGMSAFIAFIMYMVVTMFTDSNYDHDLVTEDYYRQEMELQDNIYAEENARDSKQELSLQRTEQGLFILFSNGEQINATEGSIHFYRPSDDRMDFTVPLQKGEKQIFVPAERLVDGQYRLTMSYTHDGKVYRLKKSFKY